MNKHLIAAAVALAATGSAQAITYTYDANTTGAPTYNRTVEDFSALSLLGANVAYQTLPFTVSASGTYTFSSVAAIVSGTTRWDNFLFLYSPSFAPAAPQTNGLIGNDDSTGVGFSGFTYGLTAGTSYVLVTTGFESIDFGAYTNTIDGPGSVNVVPEPATYGMLALGLLGVSAAARRRLRSDALA
jgi:hypothetical protein